MRHRLLLTLLSLVAVLRVSAQIVWVSPCTDRTFCFDAGNCSGGTVTLWEEAATGCGNPKINYSYRIDLGNNGSFDIQSNDDTVNMVLPAGTHAISWRATDNCGNINQGCPYTFTIKDCTPPSLVCVNGLAQNLISPECAVTFDVRDFILNMSDNCTPTKDLNLGIRVIGQGVGFPPDTSLTFGVCQQGNYPVQVWVRDGNGLSNVCNSYVLVQENAGLCICNEAADIGLAGCARNADSVRLANFSVQATLKGMPLQGQPISDTLQQPVTDSCFNLLFPDLPLNANYTGSVRARRSGDPLDGVSTFDLVLINRHILGQQPLKNFYHVLAGDVNQSNSLTTFDIIEIRKLILGIYDTFPQTTSWRCIRPVPDPLNLAGFAEVRDTYAFSVPNLLGDTVVARLDFVGVKMGDVNGNASLHHPVADDRTHPVVLWADAAPLRAGEIQRVAFRVAEAGCLDGWQLALQADLDAVDIIDVHGLPPQGVALLPNGELRFSHVAEQPIRLAAGEVLVAVDVLAKTSGLVADALRPMAAPMAAELYPTGANRPRPMAIRFAPMTAGSDVLFFPPQPNPFQQEAVFTVELRHPQTVVLDVFDLTGKPVYHTSRQLEAGRHRIVLPAEAAGASDVLVYRIQAGGKGQSGRLVRGR